jgi:hypothetical protein
MKFCYQCGRVTAGEPIFCGSCGRSFDVKLCPRLHQNPRYAEVCSRCGNRELSTPQPRVPFGWKILEFLVRVFLGVALVLVSIAVLLALLRRPEVQAGLIIIAIPLGVLWWLWSLLPEWFRKLIHKSIRRKERERE